MHPQLTYLLARDHIREQMARAERDRPGAAISDTDSAERRKHVRIIPGGVTRGRMSRQAAAEMADQR
ncbi:MAG: hypothetical protein ACLP4R_07680 [Solirubrobacteraceae bacterium]